MRAVSQGYVQGGTVKVNCDFRAGEPEFSCFPNFFLLEGEPAQKIAKRKKLLHMMLRLPNIRECVLFPRDMYRVVP